jgi:ArsR family transcriptional regulator, arsenate/arsenite/antimonite-responsive transcriptional repressor
MTRDTRGRYGSRVTRHASRGTAPATRANLTPQFFRALADPTRLRLVNLLVRGTLCVCDLQRIVGEPQSTVSRHLSYLKAAGVVTDRRDGVRIFYALTPDQDGLRLAVLDAIRGHFGRGVSQFADDLTELERLRSRGECHEEPAAAAGGPARRKHVANVPVPPA